MRACRFGVNGDASKQATNIMLHAVFTILRKTNFGLKFGAVVEQCWQIRTQIQAERTSERTTIQYMYAKQ
jgi:hypothetical protein